MSDIKSRTQNLNPNVQARNLQELIDPAGNIYKSLSIIEQRARYLNDQIKQELNKKLEEFATVTETIEEITENKEQIEIAKFYERLPNPVVIATSEYLEGQLVVKTPETDDETVEEEA